MPYTIHDTPQTIARIETDLDLVQEAVREADPALRSLVLTGGFARGEGAMLDGEPQNDYDLVAIRGRGRTKVPYEELRLRLEDHIGLHLDLAPVPTWRLPWVGGSIFWYETAWRGKILWGADLLGKIPVRRPADLKRAEGLRLLVNRAAGLLLVTESDDAHARRIQAAKALLGVLDVHLLATGTFPPSQTERWLLLRALEDEGKSPPALRELLPALDWAYRYKVEPDAATPTDPHEVWLEARAVLLAAVPTALRHAGYASLEAYARSDSVVDSAYYLINARRVPGAPRLARNPTGKVRHATLRLLEAAVDGHVSAGSAASCLGAISRDTSRPLALLDGLRGATLQ